MTPFNSSKIMKNQNKRNFKHLFFEISAAQEVEETFRRTFSLDMLTENCLKKEQARFDSQPTS